MNKILEINEDVVSIGLSNGSLIEVRKIDLNFEPRIGDYVEVFQNEAKTTVILSDLKEKINSSQNQQEGNGVNIHINNDHSNNLGANHANIASGKVVSKVTYVVLAMLLGGFGGHKFYAGKIGLGIVYLIFCWTYIPSIIGFIEGIIGLTKESDPSGKIIV